MSVSRILARITTPKVTTRTTTAFVKMMTCADHVTQSQLVRLKESCHHEMHMEVCAQKHLSGSSCQSQFGRRRADPVDMLQHVCYRHQTMKPTRPFAGNIPGSSTKARVFIPVHLAPATATPTTQKLTWDLSPQVVRLQHIRGPGLVWNSSCSGGQERLGKWTLGFGE